MSADPRSRPAPTTRARLVVLGAGRAVRGDLPAAVAPVDGRGSVMDWIDAAFVPLGADTERWFVGGYGAEVVAEQQPRFRLVMNHDWERTGPAFSLALVPPADITTYACYSDVVFRPAAVEALGAADGEVVLAVDTLWQRRYDNRVPTDLERAEKVRLAPDGTVITVGRDLPVADAHAEFAGLLRLGPEAARTAGELVRSGAVAANAGLPDLVNALVVTGLIARTVDLHGEWAELDAKQDLARFVLGTKAESLERLRSMPHGGVIGALVAFTWSQWQADPTACIDRALREVTGPALIVRSSARTEDGWTESGAGRHTSVLDVPRAPSRIAAAIDEVFGSYTHRSDDDQVLIQEMLRDVVSSGVVMTRTHDLGAPYYVVNFDDSTARTDTVTSGERTRTLIVHRGGSAVVPEGLAPVLDTVVRIERLVGHDSLDIEFAVTADARVHVLQVRPIAMTSLPNTAADEAVVAALGRAVSQFERLSTPSPTVLGPRPHFSVMTDWNPAEIIGTTPRRLARSLYRLLITDDTWARQRAEYGYRDVRPQPLLVDFVGHPYVDVRASFTSFVPAALTDDAAGRLVAHALDHLAAHPHLHDKVEFDVLLTCMTADHEHAAARLRSSGLPDADLADLRRALVTLTRAGMDRLGPDLAAMHAVDTRIDRLRDSVPDPLDALPLLLDAARHDGTLVFAHLARGAFVATALLRSLVAVGALDPGECAAFLASVETVLGRMQSDGRAVAEGRLPWEAFVRRYAHLRPGTYDITSPRYGDDPDGYLRPLCEGSAPGHDAPPFTWSSAARTGIAAALGAVDLPDDVDGFEAFARGAIAGREEAKFVFTKALSAALEQIAALGARHGLTRDDLAHVGIDDVLACRDSALDPAHFLAERAREGREQHRLTLSVCLPGQITSTRDFEWFEQHDAEPNFVTQQAVEAAVLAGDVTPAGPVEGAIICIPNADPGYDWLLARGIAGLVTMYGGANSHMAVRASELRLPSAIGVGEVRYAQLARAAVVRLDCAARTITVVR